MKLLTPSEGLARTAAMRRATSKAAAVALCVALVTPGAADALKVRHSHHSPGVRVGRVPAP